jgi:hypothetical protein
LRRYPSCNVFRFSIRGFCSRLTTDRWTLIIGRSSLAFGPDGRNLRCLPDSPSERGTLRVETTELSKGASVMCLRHWAHEAISSVAYPRSSISMRWDVFAGNSSPAGSTPPHHLDHFFQALEYETTAVVNGSDSLHWKASTPQTLKPPALAATVPVRIHHNDCGKRKLALVSAGGCMNPLIGGQPSMWHRKSLCSQPHLVSPFSSASAAAKRLDR